MAKRFTSTEIWEEDWFLEMPLEYKLFWFYILSACNHAGLFRVNMRKFCGLNEVNLTSTKALEYFNKGKDRIRVVNENVWLIEDFFFFQYGPTFNPNNRVHKSIESAYNQYSIKLTSIRGLLEVKGEDTDRVKDKDKDMYLDNNTQSVKLAKNGKSKNEQFSGNFRSQAEELFANRVRNGNRD
jgi:hypothetical protein